MALNFTFNEAISFQVNCLSQEEVDHFWGDLSAGGRASRHSNVAGLRDKFGVSWQIVPVAMMEMIKDPDTKKSQRAMLAMMQMKNSISPNCNEPLTARLIHSGADLPGSEHEARQRPGTPTRRRAFWRDDALPFIEARSIADGREVCYTRHAHEHFSIGAITAGRSTYLHEQSNFEVVRRHGGADEPRRRPRLQPDR